MSRPAVSPAWDQEERRRPAEPRVFAAALALCAVFAGFFLLGHSGGESGQAQPPAGTSSTHATADGVIPGTLAVVPALAASRHPAAVTRPAARPAPLVAAVRPQSRIATPPASAPEPAPAAAGVPAAEAAPRSSTPAPAKEAAPAPGASTPSGGGEAGSSGGSFDTSN